MSLFVLGISGLFKEESFNEMMSSLFLDITGMELSIGFGFYIHIIALITHCSAIYLYNKGGNNEDNN